MLNADDYFAKRRAELGFERTDTLTRVQQVLDSWYPGLVRAKRLDKGLLDLVTASAAVAGELRLRQMELLTVVKLSETKLRITVGTIER